LSRGCWVWEEGIRCCGLSKGCFGKIPSVRMGLWKGARGMV
jgi:hypothetical protein